VGVPANNVKRPLRAIALLLLALFLVSSCTYFVRQPALPRREAIEPAGSEEKYAGLLQDADIIYFPSESVTLRSRSDAAWKLLEALRDRGGSFAIGSDWSGNEGDRRNYLDEAGKVGAEILALHEAKWRAQNDAGLGADQFVADSIATYVLKHPNEKILVFLSRDRLGLGEGVPFLVGQKTKARQLILNPRKRSESGARLLAAR
jgi:hypothetical protein